MENIPLRPFLTVLQTDGIRVTVRDIDRIVTVLHTGDAWTLDRLRDTLLALLAKDEFQQEIISQRFSGFFQPDLENQNLHIDSNVDLVMIPLRKVNL